jgi:threonine/homoserine/homoserine lactone efflux protein
MFEFFIFAFVTAITPGPNNSLLMASGIKFGRKASIPHFLGIWLGFTFLFFVGGFLLTYVPAEIFNYLQYVGYAVITYIAYRVATTSLDTNKKGSSVRNLLHLYRPVFSNGLIQKVLSWLYRVLQRLILQITKGLLYIF